MNSDAQALKKTLSWAIDPLNRFYRYRLCSFLVPFVKDTILTPNQVTFLHTVFAIMGAIALGTGAPFWIAFILFETRSVLDCFDGVLAREKKMASTFGRTIDTIGDAIGFFALMTGIYLRIKSSSAIHSSFPLELIIASVTLIVIVCAGVHDFYKRKFTALLLTGIDEVKNELMERKKIVHSGKASFVTKLGYNLDYLQFKLLSSRHEVTPEELLTLARQPKFSVFMALVGLLGGDNLLFLLMLGVLFGQLELGLLSTLGYGVFFLILNIFTLRRI